MALGLEDSAGHGAIAAASGADGALVRGATVAADGIASSFELTGKIAGGCWVRKVIVPPIGPVGIAGFGKSSFPRPVTDTI